MRLRGSGDGGVSAAIPSVAAATPREVAPSQSFKLRILENTACGCSQPSCELLKRDFFALASAAFSNFLSRLGPATARASFTMFGAAARIAARPAAAAAAAGVAANAAQGSAQARAPAQVRAQAWSHRPDV